MLVHFSFGVQSGVDQDVLASLAKQSDVLFSVTEPQKNVGKMMTVMIDDDDDNRLALN